MFDVSYQMMILNNKIVNTFSVILQNFFPQTRESMSDLNNKTFFVFNLLIALKEMTYKVNSFSR